MDSSEQGEENKVWTRARRLIEMEERVWLISAGSSWSPSGVLRCVSLTHGHTKTEKLQARTTSVGYMANDPHPSLTNVHYYTSPGTTAGSEFVLTHACFSLFKIAGTQHIGILERYIMPLCY